METNSINCPNCGTSIDVNKVLYSQVEEKLRNEKEKENSSIKKELENTRKSLEKEKSQLIAEKKRIQEDVDEQVQLKLKSEKIEIEKSVRAKIQSESESQITELQRELSEKSNKLKELNKTKAEVERLKREKDELREEIILEKEKELSDLLKKEREKIAKQHEEENLFKLKEKEKVIDDLKKQLDTAKKKAEQGSIQLQGEVQELELERVLKNTYPTDEINEVKKGQKGADVLQSILENGVCAGKIYYESKRTKNFDYKWIKKLNEDNLEIKADVLVLVSEAMPDGEEKFFFKDNVWVCSFFEVQTLSMVLRKGVCDLFNSKAIQNGKESKMEMLYNYLTGPEFKGQLEAIIDGFSSIQKGYVDERNRMTKIWAERQVQLDKILSNTVGFYGKLKGIAGVSIQDIKMLEEESQKRLN